MTASSDTALSEVTTYYYRICTYKSLSNSAYSNIAQATTAIAPPTNLWAASISPTQVTVVWQDNSNNESGYRIERSSDGLNFAMLTMTGPSITTYSNAYLIEGAPYYYRVCAYNSAGRSTYSNIVPAATLLEAPTGLTATAVSSAIVTLNWVDHSYNETGFAIERKDSATGLYAQIATVGQNAADYTNANAPEPIVCYYRVRAYNSTGYSNYTSAAAIPVRGWSQITVGGAHTVALMANGTLRSWGDNSVGQLGLGDSGAGTNRLWPVQIGLDTDWAEVTAGDAHTVAINNDGTLWAWGDNEFGQLGTGTSGWGTNRKSPYRIDYDTDWIQVTAGEFHNIARKSGGTLWSWGYNFNGQLGLGDILDRSYISKIGSDSDWTSVRAGGSHTVALKADGTLWAWGDNSSGQLGLGDIAERYLPVQEVLTETDWAQVAAGGAHTIGRKLDGTLWAWGDNESGQLGLGDSGAGTNRLSPTPVGADTDWVDIVAGGLHTVAIKSDGTLYGWGDNSKGQLGLGDTANRTTPTKIGTATYLSAAAGGWFTVAILKTNGTLWTWGDNSTGQLGLGDTTDRTMPTLVGQ
ncbi:MAG: fibronectin type III domain-containing protein [Planctomycetes bacterium]|nr:fibronectin type III domain-containing protein [Planctomycetota bacterium]